MGKGKLATLVLVTVLLLHQVQAGPSHEDYDKAELDERTVLFFIEETLMGINLTLEAVLSDDVEALEGGSLFLVQRLEDISETMEKIPKAIDSYRLLEDYREGMKGLEMNLSFFMNTTLELLEMIEEFRSFNITTWNLSVLQKSLLGFDNAIIGFEPAMNGALDAYGKVKENLEQLEESGLDLSHQLEILERYPSHHAELLLNSTSGWRVYPHILAHILPLWSDSLRSINDGNGSRSGLRGALDLLELVRPLLRSDLGELVQEVILEYSSIANSCGRLGDGFPEAEQMLRSLEEGGLEGIARLYSETGALLDSIEGDLEFQWSVWENISVMDDGPLDENLTELEIGLQRFLDRYDEVTLFTDSLLRISGMISDLVSLNVLDPDMDGDGNLSMTEAIDLALPEQMDLLVLELISLENELQTEMKGIDPEDYGDVISLYNDLNSTSDAAVSLSIQHTEFQRRVRNLVLDQGSDEKLKTHFFGMIGSYLGMRSSLVKLNESYLYLNNTILQMNISGEIEDMFRLLDLYGTLLEDISVELNISGLFIMVDKIKAPYDSAVIVSALLATVPDPTFDPFPSGEPLSLALDGVNITRGRTLKGITSMRVELTRDLSIGPHNITVSYSFGNNSVLTARTAVEVRKLLTRVQLEASSYLVSPDEMFNVSVSVVDEMNRIVGGNASLGKEELLIEGRNDIPVSLKGPGDEYLRCDYPGDQWYESSWIRRLFNVSTDPVIEVLPPERQVLQGNPFNITVRVLNGKGALNLTLDGNGYLDINVSFGDEFTVSINTSSLETGQHQILPYIITVTPLVRNGSGPRVVFNVLERPPVIIPEEPEKPDEPDENETPLDDDEERSEELSPLLKTIRLVATVILVILLIVTAVLLIVRRVRTKDKIEIYIPGRVFRRKRSSWELEGDAEMKTLKQKKDTEIADRYPELRKMDPNKARVIGSYLDVVERAPFELRLNGTDTPREINDKFVRNGADREAADGLTRNVEDALYREERPTEEMVRNVDSSSRKLINWFVSIRPPEPI